ncbi:hypothetical protein ACQCUZ_15830 [Sutcliffiella horikoshii]
MSQVFVGAMKTSEARKADWSGLHRCYEDITSRKNGRLRSSSGL